jgi:outer membrane receptor protein involved in Fe transport
MSKYNLNKKHLLWLTIIPWFSSFSLTQDEQVTVVGSLIKGTPIDTGSPISTFSAEEISAQGNLNIVELIKMVPGSSGMDGEANQFGANQAEGIANINLRGLGTNRTLVLINGKRQVTVPSRTGAGRSVNLHDLPMAALSRIEILKEGAAATYGSDAIAGVVNFITDSSFEGLKVNLSAKGMPGAENQAKEFSITYGSELDDGTNFLLSLGQQHKPDFFSKNTDFTKKSVSQNPYGGWSTIGNPGTFIMPLNNSTSQVELGDPGCNAAGGYHTPENNQSFDYTDSVNGASTINLLGHRGKCRFNYAYFDNVQERQTNSQLWMEFNGSVDEHDFHIEFAYGKTDVPRYATSPAYPPNDPNSSYVPNIHPGLQRLFAQFPVFEGLMDNVEFTGADGTDPASYHRMRTRPFAASGNPNGNVNGAQVEMRKYDTYRFAFDFEGKLNSEIDYSAGLNYSMSESEITFSDTQAHKYTAALFGYGGPNCGYIITDFGNANNNDPIPTLSNGNNTIIADIASDNRPNGCEFLNVFSNAVEQAQQPFFDNQNFITNDNQVGTVIGDRVGLNPNYDSNFANSKELLAWLVDTGRVEAESTLLTLDFTLQGFLGNFSGGNGAWAFGYERRDYNIKQSSPALPGLNSYNAQQNIFDGDLHPCNLPSLNANTAARENCLNNNPTGLFMFLPPTFGRDDNQKIDSLFAEFALPVLDNFDLQLALRYEDYDKVNSLDPKIVMRWIATDDLTIRFTGQTTFRAPHPDEIWNKRYTELEFIGQTGAFKAVDKTGNANLDPEEATTFNLGLITDFGTDNWQATFDYYNFVFDNPIIVESAPKLAAAYAAGGELRTAVRTQVFGPGGINDGLFDASEINRITTLFVNGPKTETDGLDIFIKYEDDYRAGTISTGLEAAYIIDYKVSAYLKNGVQVVDPLSCNGFFNISNSCRSMPNTKAKGFINYKTSKHNFYGALNYISSYKDERATQVFGRSVEIASHTTLDATYTYSWDKAFDFSVSVYNLTDKKPPFVYWDMSYDPNTHNPLGRFIKVGFNYKMQ